MKIELELKINTQEDGRIFLNFWNPINGDDVVCEVKDGHLFHDDKQISLPRFIELVHEKVKKW